MNVARQVRGGVPADAAGERAAVSVAVPSSTPAADTSSTAAPVATKQATARAAALADLLTAVAQRRDEFSANQQLSDDVVDLMKAAGVYRALVARRFGGDEVSPAEFLRLIETISKADGSAGWVASFGVSAIYLSALPIATLESIYAHGPDVVFAGGIFPPQRAVPVPGGLEVSGRWSWGSGCCGAQLIGVGVKPADGGTAAGGAGRGTSGAGATGGHGAVGNIAPDGGPAAGLPRTAVMPRDQVRIVRNWEVNGLKGTGSHDIVVDQVLVPDAWTFIRGGPSSLDTPLYRYPSMALAAQVLAVVALGIARAALDDITAMAGGRTSITGAPVLADRAYVQTGIAEAEAALRSARAFFFETTDQVYATLVAGDPIDPTARNLLRLSSSHAAKVGADVAQTAFRLSGTTGIFTANSIAQRFQDALVVPQHAFLSEGTWQSAGRVFLGLDTPPGFP